MSYSYTSKLSSWTFKQAAVFCTLLILTSTWVVCSKMPSYDPWNSIHDAALEGHLEAVKQHLADGVDVNVKRKGSTPLHYAALTGHKEIAELLITNGADVNAKTSIVRTPLDNALIGSHHEIADLLRKHGGKTGEELKAAGN